MICGTLTQGIASLSPGLGSGGSLSRSDDKPHNMRISLDLPDSLGPRKQKVEPFATENETSFTAVKCPKRLVNASQEVMVSVGILVELSDFGARQFLDFRVRDEPNFPVGKREQPLLGRQPKQAAQIAFRNIRQQFRFETD